tara:strand:+ start:262 stop:1431 length:1170 start_codon:yes stop_codon:yes gene_type:complete
MSSNLMANYGRFELGFDRGVGSYLYTPEGDRYLDFASGIAVTSLGHSHPALLASANKQLEKLWHVSNLYTIESQSKLAERLCKNSFADKVFFCNSGAEAVEASLKLARIYHNSSGAKDRWKVISFRNGFHGRTFATIAASGQPKYLQGFGPVFDGFTQVNFLDIEAVRSVIDSETAAILVEPIQGEGGIHVASDSFLKELREICDKNDLLLIFDEVQCGVGRSGRMWAHEWSGVKPDIMATAKALGGGFPIGACMAIEEVGNAFIPGTHGSTFGGNPVASAIANTVLDIVDEREFLQNVTNVGDILVSNLQEVIKRSSIISEIRGRGLMVGLQCLIPAGDVISAFRKQKLLSVGAEGNTVRFLPPLIINELEVNEACTAVSKALQRLEC